MADKDPEPGYEIIGVSLHGPAPLDWLHLKWDEALTVLYGPNGAGKTTILKGVRYALTGSKSSNGEAFLHIRLTEAAHPLDRDFDYPRLWLDDRIAEGCDLLGSAR